MLKRKKIKTYKYGWMKIKSNSPIDIDQIIKIYQIVDEGIYFNLGYYNNIARTIYHALDSDILSVEFKYKRFVFYPTKFIVFIKLTWKNV